MAMPAELLERLPLESGDRLSREEFHRRYEESPEIKKAELIDGVVYVASPARRIHAQPHAAIMLWLGTYAAGHTDHVEVLDTATVLLGDDDEVQPDALLRRTSDGMSKVTRGQYIEGPPEFIAEVAASSASYDLHNKFRLYERSGVQEYVVWQVYDRKIRWFRLQDGAYVEQTPGADGFIESHAFPGLRLAPDALLAGDTATVIAAQG